MTTRRAGRRDEGRRSAKAWRSGLTMSVFSCVSRVPWNSAGSDSTACAMKRRISGTLSEIWCAIVVHEVFLSVEAGDALDKEERGSEDATLVQPGNGLRNGGLARAARAVEPRHAAVALLARESCFDHREDGVSSSAPGTSAARTCAPSRGRSQVQCAALRCPCLACSTFQYIREKNRTHPCGQCVPSAGVTRTDCSHPGKLRFFGHLKTAR